ncbi:hypothetical protein SprV_0200993000 [Sparganum proliferum]
MRQSSNSANGRGIGSPLITTGDSRRRISPEISSLTSSSTISMASLRKYFSRNSSLASTVIDKTLAALHLQEERQAMQTHLYATFVDFTKAFGTVTCEGLWKIMQKFSCPERFMRMLRQLHFGMMTCVTNNGTTYEVSAVTNGVNPGCVIAPYPLNLMLSVMLMDDERPGIRVAYRTDGRLNVRHMRTSARLSTTTIHDLLLGNDCAFNTGTEADMQGSMNPFAFGYAIFGLIINTDTTAIAPPNAAYSISSIPLSGIQLKTVDKFV